MTCCFSQKDFMPVKIRKVKGGYSVLTPGGTKSRKTTKRKAQSQQRLLNAIDRGFTPNQDRLRRKVIE